LPAWRHHFLQADDGLGKHWRVDDPAYAGGSMSGLLFAKIVPSDHVKRVHEQLDDRHSGITLCRRGVALALG
jgi:hypothetical protein